MDFQQCGLTINDIYGTYVAVRGGKISMALSREAEAVALKSNTGYSRKALPAKGLKRWLFQGVLTSFALSA